MTSHESTEDRDVPEQDRDLSEQEEQDRDLPEQERDLPSHPEELGGEVPDAPWPEAHDPERFPRRPSALTESPARIQDRSYDSYWAAFPLEEVDGTTGPGAGPHGSIGTGGLHPPAITIGIGFLLIFLTFFVANPIPLALGALLVLVGALWTGFGYRHPGHFKGVGTSKVKARNLKQ